MLKKNLFFLYLLKTGNRGFSFGKHRLPRIYIEYKNRVYELILKIHEAEASGQIIVGVLTPFVTLCHIFCDPLINIASQMIHPPPYYDGSIYIEVFIYLQIWNEWLSIMSKKKLKKNRKKNFQICPRPFLSYHTTYFMNST